MKIQTGRVRGHIDAQAVEFLPHPFDPCIRREDGSIFVGLLKYAKGRAGLQLVSWKVVGIQVLVGLSPIGRVAQKHVQMGADLFCEGVRNASSL